MMEIEYSYRVRTAFVALLLLALGAAWYAYHTRPEPFEIVFVAEGNLVKDTPGFTPGIWYLTYAESGFPALSVPLVFNAASVCGEKSSCDSLLVGDRVRIEGVREENGVLVRSLTFTRPDERGIPIKLYYYDPSKDKDESGNLRCSARGLVAVDRVLPHTGVPLYEAIKLLLRGEISDEEKTTGLTSEFPLFGLRLEKVDIRNGVATIIFSDPQHKTSGGSCRIAILLAQINATASQFPGLTSLRIEPEDLFQP